MDKNREATQRRERQLAPALNAAQTPYQRRGGKWIKSTETAMIRELQRNGAKVIPVVGDHAKCVSCGANLPLDRQKAAWLPHKNSDDAACEPDYFNLFFVRVPRQVQQRQSDEELGADVIKRVIVRDGLADCNSCGRTVSVMPDQKRWIKHVDNDGNLCSPEYSGIKFQFVTGRTVKQSGKPLLTILEEEKHRAIESEKRRRSEAQKRRADNPAYKAVANYRDKKQPVVGDGGWNAVHGRGAPVEVTKVYLGGGMGTGGRKR